MLTTRRKTSFFFWGTAACILAIYIVSFQNVQRHIENQPSSERAEALILPPAFLKIAAGEFKGLMADYLLLKGATFLGGRHDTTQTDMQAVETLFRQSLALDPYFFQTCYLTQAFLAWRGNQVDDAIDLLKISNNHRDWDWNPGFFIGFDYYYFLNDNLSAARYLMEVAKHPAAGALPGLLAARLSQKGGETETGLVFLKSMYSTIEDDNTRKQIERRITTLERVYVIEKAIAVYRAQYNREPDDLQELVSSGILEKLPENPYMTPFTLEDGVVVF